METTKIELDRDSNGTVLFVHTVLNNATGHRRYYLTESRKGVERGRGEKENCLHPRDISEQPKKVERMIESFTGEYSYNTGRINSILERLTLIVQDSEQSFGLEGVERIGPDLAFERMIKFILENPTDSRVAIWKIRGEVFLGIVGRGGNTARQNFTDLCRELFPEEDYKKLKDAWYTDGRLRCDEGDCQLTLSARTRKLLEIRGDKAYAFRFPPKFNRKTMRSWQIATEHYRKGGKQDAANKGK